MENEKNPLFEEKPYSYKLQKGNTAQILYRKNKVHEITGKEYNKLLRVIALDNIYELQLFLDKLVRQKK